MFKYVDECESLDGWAFVDDDCVEYFVTIPQEACGDNKVVEIGDDDVRFAMYVHDIPLMIKALQAAYDYKGTF